MTSDHSSSLHRPRDSDAAPLSDDSLVHELISFHAKEDPSRLALASRNGTITYGELDRRANQLANHLRAMGVGPDVVVGLCLDRSPALAVAALGTLKAGGAYLPLEATNPQERLAFMLRDSGARVLLTQASMVARFDPLHMDTVVHDRMESHLDREETEAPRGSARSHHLAYVVYTSGSTGTPKGVMIEHGSLLNLVRWTLQAFAVTANDRASHLASPAFDVAGWELWPYLVVGASVHFVEDTVRADIAALRDWMETERITIGCLPTALAEAALDLNWSPTTALRLLLTGGDTLRRYPRPDLPFAIVNNYGPTEATVVTTSGVVPAGEPSFQQPSIGRPISNTRVYIVDSSLRRVPRGAEGELLISGKGVARGYLNRPDLTKEKFIPDPFCGDSVARAYRTGDLVRQRPSGELDFVGRLDEQIKIHGFRIEPAEITTALNTHPGIRYSAVIGREGAAGDQRLTAYVVAKREARPESVELRSHLSRLLPYYMIPHDFVYLDGLPMTANGKVDRRALPTPEEGVPRRSVDSRDPRTEVEHQLIAMVSELLGLEHVGVDENLFMVGGYSLFAAHLVARIRDRFTVEVALISIFQAGTIANLAAELERLRSRERAGREVENDHAVIAQLSGGIRPILFFLVSDESGLIALRHFVRAVGPEQPVVALVPPRRNRRFQRDKSLVQLAEALLEEIREHQPRGPYCLCGHSLGGLLAYEVAGQLRAGNEEVAWLGLLDTMNPAVERVARARERGLGSRLRQLKASTTLMGPRALQEVALRRLQLVKASFRLPLRADEYDYPGLVALTNRYRAVGHDAPLDLFATRDWRWRARSPGLGWEQSHRGPFRFHAVSGDHHSLLHQPDVTALEMFAGLLRAAQAGRTREVRSSAAAAD